MAQLVCPECGTIYEKPISEAKEAFLKAPRKGDYLVWSCSKCQKPTEQPYHIREAYRVIHDALGRG